MAIKFGPFLLILFTLTNSGATDLGPEYSACGTWAIHRDLLAGEHSALAGWSPVKQGEYHGLTLWIAQP